MTRDDLRQEYIQLNPPSAADIATCDAVVVLSAEEVEVEGNNQERIMAGLDLATASPAKAFVYMGTKAHNEHLKVYMLQHRPEVTVYYPTDRLQDSTKTQVHSLSFFFKKHPFTKVLVVSNAYHIPRIMRYCQKYLPDMDLLFYPVGDMAFQKDLIEGEVEKIFLYASQGDLPLELI
ncbi:MAG: ElyC/SanA/YdcF family protein [bacterium]